MAEETKKAAPQPEKTDAPAKKKPPLRSIVILVVVMALEGGIFGGLMMAMRPKDAGAVQETPLPTQPVDTAVELELVSTRAPNYQTGATIFYDLTIHLKVDVANKEKVVSLIDKHKATIQDRLRTIIAEAEPRYFSEAQLTTLKGKIAAMLDSVVGEGLAKEVLIVDCMPFKAP